MRVERSESHLDGRGAPVGAALEVGKVPPGRDEVGAHALDGVDEHANVADGAGFAVVDDVIGDRARRCH